MNCWNDKKLNWLHWLFSLLEENTFVLKHYWKIFIVRWKKCQSIFSAERKWLRALNSRKSRAPRKPCLSLFPDARGQSWFIGLHASRRRGTRVCAPYTCVAAAGSSLSCTYKRWPIKPSAGKNRARQLTYFKNRASFPVITPAVYLSRGDLFSIEDAISLKSFEELIMYWGVSKRPWSSEGE